MPVIEWVLEAMLSYAIKGLVARLGHTKTGEHIKSEFENAKKLNPEINPPPASERHPVQFPDQ